ncbi:MAG: DUF6055 domain-containing protein [Nocardioides sp.]
MSASGDTDRATRAWVDETMTVMKAVWKKEIGKFDYRAPRPDKKRGGNAKLDVYLKDLGRSGLYGYCTPEKPVNSSYPFVYFGYCVLDNDYSPGQYGGVPALNSLKVTAAHEFFHAVQFAYDTDEDPWFMESTATWMEERFADNVNDNRQYLSASQIAQPHVPLDFYSSGSFNQYGNWVWWEYLTSRYGRAVVKTAWEKAGAYSKKSPDMWSTKATAAALKAHGGFASVYGAYASGNLVPASSYPEGAAWAVTPLISTTHVLTAGAATASGSQSVDHMSARHVKFVPAETLTGDWEIAIHVEGPWEKASPVVKLRIDRTNGTTAMVNVKLNAQGDGSRRVTFSYATIKSVTLTVANASTRFACWKGTDLSCKGIPKDDDRVFSYTAEADPV